MADALSDVLRSIRLRGGVFLDARFTTPWAVNSVVTTEDCKPLLASPAQLIAYHFTIEGHMLLSVVGEPSTTVQAGEIVLLPRNDEQVLASGPGITPVDGTVGYESEEAFSRAFKREVGISPTRWREQLASD